MLFGEGQFEKPGAGVNPEGKPAEGQPEEEVAEQPEGQEGTAEATTEKREETQESIEKRYQERMGKLQGVLRDLANQYHLGFDNIMTIVAKDNAAFSLDEAKLTAPGLRDIINSAREKHKEIEEEKRVALEWLRTQKVTEFGSRIGNI